jgi:hypothetical protein
VALIVSEKERRWLLCVWQTHNALDHEIQSPGGLEERAELVKGCECNIKLISDCTYSKISDTIRLFVNTGAEPAQDTEKSSSLDWIELKLGAIFGQLAQ